MKKNSLIRTIYLYSFALLGLVLLIISGVRFIDMGLKAFIFTQAEEEQRVIYKAPVACEELSQEERVMSEQQLADYDPIVSQRHRDASSSLAMILIGLPLYLYHWAVIKRETRS